MTLWVEAKFSRHRQCGSKDMNIPTNAVLSPYLISHQMRDFTFVGYP